MILQIMINLHMTFPMLIIDLNGAVVKLLEISAGNFNLTAYDLLQSFSCPQSLLRYPYFNV